MSHPSVQPVVGSQGLRFFVGFIEFLNSKFLFENQTILHIGSLVLSVLPWVGVGFQNTEYNASCVTFKCRYTIKNINLYHINLVCFENNIFSKVYHNFISCVIF